MPRSNRNLPAGTGVGSGVGGGTLIIDPTAPGGAREEFITPAIGGTTRPFGGGGQGSGGGQAQQPKVYESALLKQSFSTKEAKERAEQQYFIRQIQIKKEQEKQRQLQEQQRRSIIGGSSGVTSTQYTPQQYGQAEVKGYGAYIPSSELPGGVKTAPGYYTTTGKFYPDLGAGSKFTPRGYRTVEADISGRNITFKVPVTGTSTSQQIEKPSKYGAEVITKADDSYKTYIKEKNPFTGTVTYVVEKTRGKLAKEDIKQGGQSAFTGETGRRVSIGTQTAPYFIPATAPLFLLGTGIGAVTPGGITESKKAGKAIEEKTGIPSKIASYGFTGLQVTGGIFGGAGVIKQAGKLAGYPKYEVISKSEPVYTTLFDEGAEIKTVSKGVVTKKDFLLGNKKAVFASEELTKFGVEGDIAQYKTVSRGVSREFKGVVLPTGKLKFGKPKPYGGQAAGIVKKTEQQIVNEVAGMKQIAKVQGSDIAASIKVKQFRPERDFTESILIGKTYELPSGTVVSSKAAPLIRVEEKGAKLSKVGRTESFGVTGKIKEIPMDTGKTIIKSTKPSQTAIEETVKSQAALAAFPEKASKIRPSALFKTAKAGQIIEESKRVTSLPTKQIQSNKEIQKVTTSLNLIQPTKQKTIGALRSKQIEKTVQIPSPKIIQKTQPKIKTLFAQLTPQTIKQNQRQIKRLTYVTAFDVPIIPNITDIIKPPPLLFYRKEEDEIKKKLKKLSYKPKRKPAYAASLIAAAVQAKPVKVTRKQYEALKRKTYTGAETLPVLEVVDFNSQNIKGTNAVKF